MYFCVIRFSIKPGKWFTCSRLLFYFIFICWHVLRALFTPRFIHFATVFAVVLCFYADLGVDAKFRMVSNFVMIYHFTARDLWLSQHGPSIRVYFFMVNYSLAACTDGDHFDRIVGSREPPHLYRDHRVRPVLAGKWGEMPVRERERGEGRRASEPLRPGTWADSPPQPHN